MNKIIVKFIPPVVFGVYKKIRGFFCRTYISGNYMLKTPPFYRTFHTKYKLYNQFLPVLAKHVSSNKIIVDVGANIGDTTIDMLQKCENSFYSIEAAEKFYKYFLRNLKRLSDKDQKRIRDFNCFVGTGSVSGTLSLKNWGSATLTVNDQESMHISLDSLIEDKSEVILLKSDTDGFDYDVLFSAPEILKSSEPILYWENQIDENFQRDGYEKLYAFLKDSGYRHIYIFDNFGNLLISNSDFETLKQINTYIDNMNNHDCTRTFYYTDVLACTDRQFDKVISAIDDYIKTKIRG